MAQYYTDFSEVDAIDAWTERWVTSNVTWSIEADAGATGGKYLRGSRSSSGRSLLSWDAIDADSGRANCDILFRARGADNTAAGSGMFAIARGAGAAGNETGYRVVTAASSDNRVVTLQRYLNSAFSVLGTAPKGWASNTWYWHRTPIQGTALKMRMWAGDVGDEPATWDLEITDSGISAAGWIGAFVLAASVNHDWDVFAVGTGGDAAPTGPLTPPATKTWLLSQRSSQIIGGGTL